MTLKDSYGLSLHTIKENKSRSILTVIISTFLSMLIMGLMCIAISFVQNGNNVLNKVYFNERSIVTVQYSNSQIREHKHDVLDKDHYQSYLDILSRHQNVVSYVQYRSNVNSSRGGFTTFTDPNYPITAGIDIIEGRNIAPNKDVQEVIISQSKYSESLISDADPYKLNTVHEETWYYTSETARGKITYNEVTMKFKVVGVYTVSEEKFLVNGTSGSAFDTSNTMIADVNMLFNATGENVKDIYLSEAVIYYRNSIDGINPKTVIGNLQSLKDDIFENAPHSYVGVSNGPGLVSWEVYDSTRCQTISDYNNLQTFRLIFLLGGAFISIILLLMSVGSLANSIMISIDRSKKFIGLLKSLGLRGRDVKRVIVNESATLISVGVLIGYALLFALTVPLSSIVSALTSSMYSNYMDSITYTPSLSIPIYVLAGTIVLFILLTLLFARGSLRKISKMDPMAVISEVS